MVQTLFGSITKYLLCTTPCRRVTIYNICVSIRTYMEIQLCVTLQIHCVNG